MEEDRVQESKGRNTKGIDHLKKRRDVILNIRNEITEKYIKQCVDEFDRFIKFVESEKPTLTAKMATFGKKDSFRLDSLLSYPKNASAPNYTQDQYLYIDLMFDLALLGKLYYKGNDRRGKPILVKTPVLESYFSLNDAEKYIFLLQTYWTKYDFKEKLNIWFFDTEPRRFYCSDRSCRAGTKNL